MRRSAAFAQHGDTAVSALLHDHTINRGGRQMRTVVGFLAAVGVPPFTAKTFLTGRAPQALTDIAAFNPYYIIL